MKRCLLLLLCLSSAASAQVSHSVDLGYDDAWSAVARSLVLQGLSISGQDKAAGFIKATGPLQDGENFTCPRAGGALESRTYDVNVFLSGRDEGATVTINALANEKRYRNRKLIFITIGRVWYNYECASTGKIEKAIFEALTPSL